MWNSPGVTIERRIQDQQVTVPSVAGTLQTIPFQNLKTIGYLSKLYLYSAPNVGVTALAGGTLVQQTGAQFPQLRSIRRFRLNMQGTAPVYDVDGLDLFFLNYMRQGNTKFDKAIGSSGFSAIGAAPSTDQYPFNYPTKDNSLLGLMSQYAPYCQYNSGATALTTNYAMEIPISEHFTFPNVVIGASDKMTILTDVEIEVGLLFMQNASSNAVPQIDLAPAYGPNLDSTLLATGAATATLTNVVWGLENQYYDIPIDVANRPSAFQMGWIVQRTASDWPVAGQAVTPKFKAAGLLLRVAYVFYNDTTNHGTLVDATASGSNNTILQLDSGATMIRLRETAQMNAHRSLNRYGNPPPGILIHDFCGDGRTTQALDTAQMNGLETQITVLASSVTRCHVVEERLLNVTSS